MTPAFLEHINVTVSDPEATAKRLCDLFGWKIRWNGEAMDGGETYHVGGDQSYPAIYKKPGEVQPKGNTYQVLGGLNHVGIVVKDIDDMELRVKKLGYEPHSHGDYEPGRRFYFKDDDKIEFEVVCYS
ncbi:MAG: VOC family protein [Rhizobiaceae bacterium]|nr:VOC family protein [Rhizobiaceae bacterium]